ncbi:MAG: Rieske (2Fe-2S) protein [Candidatus Kryptoniota bacterium]
MASTDGFVKVARSSELTDRKGIACRIGDDEIAIVKLDGTVSAFMNVCPHQHTALVDKYGAQINGNNLTCPMHGWIYDLKTGNCVGESGRLKMLDVKVENGYVLVRKNPERFE